MPLYANGKNYRAINARYARIGGQAPTRRATPLQLHVAIDFQGGFADAHPSAPHSNQKGKVMASVTTPTGLVYEELTVGAGAEAASGKKVTVHYTGWLTNGTKFDSSKDRNDPFEFELGGGMVIRGWDEGVQGMQEGGTRVLVIPPTLGYGARGAGGVIPPNATLLFEVELLRA